ncbi:g3785 [Coccomyxa viridis]|uniref:G3785 protein n=1 Tax=Coccomyxa viridis TaxID=1274662 RepID=A0ABP1FRX6_9CHLO
MAVLNEASNLFTQLKGAVGKNDLQTANRLLSTIKLKLTQLPALPPQLERTPTAQKELNLARDVLEQAVFLSIQMQDDRAFERNYDQLKSYYTDTGSVLPQSPQAHIIIGLDLLRLLVENRIAEFHTELELLSPEAMQSQGISHAVQLEQWLMEGAYNKVLEARPQLPHPAYSYFMEKLLSTVREEIAECSERAYASLSTADAKKLMMFGSDQEALSYAQEREWLVKDGKISFRQVEEKSAPSMPSKDLIDNALTYAREIERIV